MTPDSRSLDDLHPVVRAKALAHIAACEVAGIPIAVTFTYRSNETQDMLYSLGRTLFKDPRDGKTFKPGQHVTNARAGQSFHNFKLAYDATPKALLALPNWGDTPAHQAETDRIWALYAKLGEAQGLEAGAHWTTFKDRPHMQWSGGLTLAQLQQGQMPPDQETRNAA